jgi:ribosomal protein L11 methyltransferase
MYWLEISVEVDGEAAEAVAELLRPYAYADSVIFEQLGDQSTADPEALESAIHVKIFVTEDDDSDAFRQKILEAFYHMNRLYPVGEPQFRVLEEDDWATAWRKNYQPFRIGEKIWIQPSWQPVQKTDIDDVVITLDPGMAFGTGLHPTTQLCLQAIEEEVRQDYRILDVGTGTGILAIAAAKLGAHHIIAFDTERQAVLAARENAIRNEVESSLFVFQGTLETLNPQPHDLILVNIIAPVIIDLLHHRRLLNYLSSRGKAILSGIISDQVGEVTAAVVRAGGTIIKTQTSGDWFCLMVENKRTL